MEDDMSEGAYAKMKDKLEYAQADSASILSYMLAVAKAKEIEQAVDEEVLDAQSGHGQDLIEDEDGVPYPPEMQAQIAAMNAVPKGQPVSSVNKYFQDTDIKYWKAKVDEFCINQGINLTPQQKVVAELFYTMMPADSGKSLLLEILFNVDKTVQPKLHFNHASTVLFEDFLSGDNEKPKQTESLLPKLDGIFMKNLSAMAKPGTYAVKPKSNEHELDFEVVGIDEFSSIQAKKLEDYVEVEVSDTQCQWCQEEVQFSSTLIQDSNGNHFHGLCYIPYIKHVAEILGPSIISADDWKIAVSYHKALCLEFDKCVICSVRDCPYSQPNHYPECPVCSINEVLTNLNKKGESSK